MTIRADMSGSGGGRLIEQGVYPCTVTDIQQKISQNTGSEYIAFEFTIASGEFEGRKLYHNNSLGAKDRNYYLRQTLEGISGEEVPEIEDFTFEERDYLGRGCQVQVVHEEYNGKVKPSVAAIHPPDEGQVIEPSTKGELQEDLTQDSPW